MMTMFTFILADAHLEPIPRKLWRHPSVRTWSKFRNKHPSKMILDQTLFYSAVRSDPELRERGRVDILHRALLTIIDSELCRSGHIRSIIIHTIRNETYIVNPKTRPPRHYFRFLGLMEKLLAEGIIASPDGKILITKGENIETIIKQRLEYIIGLSRRGNRVDLEEYIKEKTHTYSTIAFVVGAFPTGYFTEQTQQIIDDLISIGEKTYTTSYVLCKIITTCERILQV